MLFFFFFNDTATTEIYTLSLHDALPIYTPTAQAVSAGTIRTTKILFVGHRGSGKTTELSKLAEELADQFHVRSEEHTSELQSRQYLVCRLLLEKKKKYI